MRDGLRNLYSVLKDMDTVFAPELPGLDREEIRRWYNGYNWGLKHPNMAVQASLNDSLLMRFVGDLSAPEPQISRLWRVLQAGDPLALKDLFHAFFASIPNDWYRNNPITQFEGYWASIFYSHFAALGLDIRVEDTTNKGRIDMAVLACGVVWPFEFRVVELVPQGRALQQLKERGYGEKYAGRGEPVYLIGVEFSRGERNIVGFQVESGRV